MAEEGTLGTGRASDQEVEPSKEELQRRMHEARQEITQAVTEIKETVTNQYHSMKETVSDALDWRHHFRKNPIAFSVGALGAGFLLGYGIAGALKGNGREGADYPSHDETDVYARTNATPLRYEEEEVDRHSAFHGHSYAAQGIIDAPRGVRAQKSEGAQYGEAEGRSEGGERAERAGDYTYSAPREQSEEEESKPSLFDRFKETSAYERLEAEVASLGDRFIDELSKTAHNVVLPSLFNKIKELFGVDLSGKQGQQSQSRQTGQTQQTASTGAQSSNAGAANSQAASASASLASASRGGSSYGTSENRPYNAQSSGQETGRRPDDSVLDLDR